MKRLIKCMSALLLLAASACAKPESSGKEASSGEPEETIIETALEELKAKYGTVTSNNMFCPFVKDDYYPIITAPDENLIGILCTEMADLDEDGTDECLVILTKKGTDADGRDCVNLYASVIDVQKDEAIVTDETLLSQNIMKGDLRTGFAAFIKKSSSEGILIGGTGYSSYGITADGIYGSGVKSHCRNDTSPSFR